MSTAPVPGDGPVTLVTGATGFIGRRLLKAGDRALVRSVSGIAGAVVGNLLDPASLYSACLGTTTVIHCAGYAHAFGADKSDLHQQINLDGTRNLVQAAGQAGVARFVFLSSVKAMAEPGVCCVDEAWPGVPATPYGKAKRAAEDAVCEAGLKYGMHVVNLRLAMVYGRGGGGNLARLAKGLHAGWFPRLPDTGNQRSLVHVDDVVDAVRRVVDNPRANGKTYIVASNETYSGRYLCDQILEVLPSRWGNWSVPEWVLRWAGRMGDLRANFGGRRLSINSEMISKLLDSECYLPIKIERELGWQAKVSLKEGLREMLAPMPEQL